MRIRTYQGIAPLIIALTLAVTLLPHGLKMTKRSRWFDY